MEILILTLSPFAIAAITQGVKILGDKYTNIRQSKGLHKSTFRALAALLSFGAVVISALLTGAEVDALAIQTFAEALLIFLGTTGAYFLTKKKS